MKRGLFLTATLAIAVVLAGGPTHADQITYGTNGGGASTLSNTNTISSSTNGFGAGFTDYKVVLQGLAAIIGVVAGTDYAITSQSVLYGSSSKGFFSLNLKALNTNNAFTMLNKSMPVLKLSLDSTETSLIGKDHRNGKWYSVGFNGSYYQIPKPGNGAGGGGGGGVVINSVPEPSMFAMFGLGGLGLATHVLIRRKRGNVAA